MPLAQYPEIAGIGSDATTMEEVKKKVTKLKLSERATKISDLYKEYPMDEMKTKRCF